MSKQALKRVRKTVGLPVNRDRLPRAVMKLGIPLLDIPTQTMPVYYLFADGGVCCASCANRNIRAIDRQDRNSHGGWALCGYEVVCGEDDDLKCDHCGSMILPKKQEEFAGA